MLLISAVLTVLPGVLDRVKFTDVLVGHAHLAMAGMATSFGALVLVALTHGSALGRVLSEPIWFVLWHAGCAVHIGALVAAGAFEAANPGAIFGPDLRITGLYAARWAGGVLMLAASLGWLGPAVRRASA